MNYIWNSQVIGSDGTPLVDGKIFVYKHNTSELANTYKDFEGHLNTNPVILDSLGHCNIIVDYGYYDLIIKDKNDQLQFSILNVSYSDSGISPETIEIVAGDNIRVSQDENVYTISLGDNVLGSISNLALQVGRFDTTKQDKLTAGDHITIDDNVISVNEDFYTVSESDNIFSTKTQVQQIVGQIQDRLNTKQNTLLPGDGISITAQDVISTKYKPWSYKEMRLDTQNEQYLFTVGDLRFYGYYDSSTSFRLRVYSTGRTLYYDAVNALTGASNYSTTISPIVERNLSFLFNSSYPYNKILNWIGESSSSFQNFIMQSEVEVYLAKNGTTVFYKYKLFEE